jgi:Peptidase family M23
MRCHRTTAALLGLVGLVAAASAPGATGRQNGPVPRLIFPLVVKTVLWDNYGDPRPNGRHAGIDIQNPWRAPVVAVEEGTVRYWESGLGGCILYLYGRSGTTYMYIHLNNDLTAKNDNEGRCVKDVSFAVANGAKVTAGQQIAWNGDSGDANGNPHLHFEMHPHDGVDVDPFPYLKRAVKPLFPAREGSVFSLALHGQLVAAGAGAATLQVDSARKYPGGRWLDVDSREVELTVPLGTDVGKFVQIASATLRPLKKPAKATAFTLKANTTRAAIVGAPGELMLGRIAATLSG